MVKLIVFTVEQMAQVCHETNRVFCQALGDFSQESWENISEEIKNSAISGVEKFLENPDITPEEMHQNWMNFKISEGWKFGEVKSLEDKTHPDLVPFAELPLEQQMKDQIFINCIYPYILWT